MVSGAIRRDGTQRQRVSAHFFQPFFFVTTSRYDTDVRVHIVKMWADVELVRGNGRVLTKDDAGLPFVLIFKTYALLFYTSNSSARTAGQSPPCLPPAQQKTALDARGARGAGVLSVLSIYRPHRQQQRYVRACAILL